MKLGNTFDRYIAVIFFVTIFTVILTSYFTLKDIINSHDKEIQSAVTPLFSLVTSEILRPLNVSNFMAKNQLIIDYAQQKEIENDYLISYLEKISKAYNMVAFIALEKHDIMLDSNKKVATLDSNNLEWFHRLKKLPGEQFTDIGNAENPHLFFDNKIRSNTGEFIGFTGVALDLKHFANKFQEYNDRFGFELYFVDNNNIITLSSNKIIKSQSHHRIELITRLNDLPWYQSLIKSNPSDSQLNSDVIYTTKEGLLISQMPIQELNWRMFIVSPPATEQSEYWTIFISRFMLFFIIVIVFYMVLLTIINYLKSRLIKHAQTDHLTQLPNRSHIHWRFDEIVKNNNNLCLVLADIDNFKNINDNYGHVIGDEVILPAPYYIAYLDMIKFTRGTAVIVQCGADADFKITPEQLQQSITRKTRWLLLNSPSNPTGAVYEESDLRGLANVLLQHPHVGIIADDIYEHITFDGLKLSLIHI